MSPGAALRAHLVASAVVAGLAGPRIYPSRLPQKPTLPAVVYNVVSPGKLHSHDGGLNSKLARPRIQVDVWAVTYDEAQTLMEAIETALGGYVGPAGTSNDRIEGAFVEDGGAGDHDEETPQLPDGSKPFRASRDFFVWHRKE
jgi:hypothetical protein